MLKMLSLFSGIGGMDLAASWVRDANGNQLIETCAFVEIEPFCQKVLRKNFGEDIIIYDDVRRLTADSLRQSGISPESISVVAGGFPCQDISIANPNGKGIEGERSGLWSEMFRIVCKIRPQYVVVENVSNLLVRGMGTVLGDLAACGYDAEWQCIRASDVGAIHRRERTFIVAYPCPLGCGQPNDASARNDGDNEESDRTTLKSEWLNKQSRTNADSGCDASDADAVRELQPQGSEQDEWRRTHNGTQAGIRDTVADDRKERVQRFFPQTLPRFSCFSWCEDVRRVEDLRDRPDIPEPLFRGSSDGIPDWMDRIGSIGNAVMPQQVFPIFEAIASWEHRVAL